MITKKGWDHQLMLSLFKKETTYDAGVVMTGGNACLMKGFEGAAEWDDKVQDDKDLITGQEWGTDQEILMQGVKLQYKETRCKPNTLAGLVALVFGTDTPTQDGAFTAYKHKSSPIALGSALPSIQAEEKFGGLQYAYTGMKGNSLEIGGEAGGYLHLTADLIGSGSRATSATAFAAAITESWMKVGNCKVWMENGTAITIAATLTQGAQNISSGTPAVLGPRFKSFTFKHDNGLEKQDGFGGGLVAQDIDYGRRKAELKFTLMFNDGTELTHYLNQTPLAIEFDLKGALVAAGGSMYSGGQLIIPRFKLKKAPQPKGGVNDKLTCEFECDIESDGTNPPYIIETYNAIPAYLA